MLYSYLRSTVTSFMTKIITVLQSTDLDLCFPFSMYDCLPQLSKCGNMPIFISSSPSLFFCILLQLHLELQSFFYLQLSEFLLSVAFFYLLLLLYIFAQVISHINITIFDILILICVFMSFLHLSFSR